MAIINRRNAVLGWAVWKIMKDFGKRKAKTAVPGTGDHGGLNNSAIALIAAVAVGVLWFWHKTSDDATGS